MAMFFNMVLDCLRMKLRTIITEILLNLIFSLLIWYSLIVAAGEIVPRILFMDSGAYFYIGIVTMISAILAYGLAAVRFRNAVFMTGRMEQIRTGSMMFWQIYFGISLAAMIKVIIHVLLFSIVLLLLTGAGFSSGWFILYLFFQLLVIFLFVQAGFLTAIFLLDQEVYLLVVMFLITPLFLLSGALFPVIFANPTIEYIVKWNPFTAILAGGRELLLYNQINWAYTGYVTGLTLVLYFTSYYLIKRKLTR